MQMDLMALKRIIFEVMMQKSRFSILTEYQVDLESHEVTSTTGAAHTAGALGNEDARKFSATIGFKTTLISA